LPQHRQPVADRPEDVRDTSAVERGSEYGAAGLAQGRASVLTGAERAARATLRAQIAKLENELSAVLAERFPFVTAPAADPSAAPPVGGAAPCLQGLGELERTRDRLAARLGELRGRAARRTQHERRARELLRRMELEPGRYKYYRVPVRDLGQTGCGVYEVRPRLGLIGMLAGWWELTLSSGCPLCREAPRACSTSGPGSGR
jgi:hypothetical protein